MTDYRAIARSILDPENQPHQWGDYELAQFLVSAANEIERLREEVRQLEEIMDEEKCGSVYLATKRVLKKHGYW